MSEGVPIHNQIVFLLYMNRSGSTLLSALLDRYDAINVTPEANIPDNLLIKYSPVSSERDLEDYLDKLYKDKKFLGWEIDRERLHTRLLSIDYPYGFERILPEILDCYAEGRTSRTTVFKRGHYIKYVKELRQLFPGCKFIYIERDIRGIYESQKRSIDSVTGRPMARNPVERALKYVSTIRQVKKYEKGDDFFVVVFERLVSSTDDVLNEILEFLDVEPKIRSSASYYDKIPQNQRHLHRGLLEKTTQNKIDSWKQLLSESEISALQMIAGKQLIERGYSLYETRERGSLFFLLSIAELLIFHSAKDLYRKFKRRISS